MPAVFLALLLTLLQPGGVSGTVTDATGSTIPGATVQLEVAGSVVSQLETGADGRFAFPDTPAERVRLIIIAPGFVRRAVDVPRDALVPLTIELEPAPFFDAIQVTSSRGIAPRSDPTVAAIVLPAADVLAGAVALDDALRIVPGFTLFPSSRVANPTAQTMMLRGLGSGVTRSLVLADGVPLNDAFGGWVYWDKVPHAAIERVEVLRGGGADLYGADAVGGVVQILTFEPSGPMVRVLVEGGNLEMGRISAFGGGRAGNWSVTGGGQWFTTTGYILVAPDDRGGVERPSGSTHRSALASVHFASGASWRFGARASVFAEERANGTVLQVNDTDARLVSADALGALAGGFLSAHAFRGTQGYDQTFSEFEEEPPRSAESVNVIQRVPSRIGGGSVQWSRQWGDTGLLVGGEVRAIDGRTVDAQYKRGVFTGVLESGGTARLGSGFVRATMAVTGALTLVAGAHADAWQTSSRATSFEQTVGAFNPRLSMAYRIGDTGLSIRGSVYGGFRAPTLNELYRFQQVGNDVTAPNEALTPERLKSGEAGLTVTRGPASARVTGFWSVLDDAVTNVTVSTSPSLNVRRRENAGRIQSSGVEFEGDIRLSAALSLSVTGALIDSRFVGRTRLRDYRVPLVPTYSMAGTLRYRDRRWMASSQIRVTGSQYDDDLNTRTLGRSAVVDVFGGRTVARRAMVFVGVENLFDAEYDVGRIPIRVVGLPRAVRAGVQVLLP